MRNIKTRYRSLLPLIALACFVVQTKAPLLIAADSGAVFAPGPEMNVPRVRHNAATFPSGEVTVFGGENYEDDSFFASSESWNSATNKFTVYDMNCAHYMPGFAKLADGRYLLAGGNSGYAPNSITAQIYHPGTKAFTATGNLNYGRYMCGAATLTSGKVLVVGSCNELLPAKYGELFDPATNSFTPTNALNIFRAQPLVLPCADGKAIVLGGFHYTNWSIPREKVELYDHGTNSFSIFQETLFPGETGWQIWGFSPVPWFFYLNSIESQKMKDGRYLFLACKYPSDPKIYTLFTFNPVTKQIAKFVTTPELPELTIGDFYYPVVDATRGKAYLLRSISLNGFSKVCLYTIDLDSGQRNNPVGSFTLSTSSMYGHSSITLLSDSRIFITGGYEWIKSQYDYYHFVPLKRTWFITPPNLTSSKIVPIIDILLLN